MENYNGLGYGIYVYSTDTYVQKNWFKIGSTIKTFDERVLQQDVTAVPEPLKIQLTFSVIDYDITPKELEDRLHVYFDERGKRLRLDKDREWFYDITIDDIKNAIRAILVDPEAFKMRLELMPHQVDAYDFINERFDAGSRFVLLNHKPRSGKTYITYKLLLEKKYKNVLLLTNYPVLNGQWRNDALNIYNFNYDIINVCNETIDGVVLHDERPNFVMVSFQDAKGNGPMVKEKFRELRGIKWDLIIVDEVHRGKESLLTDILLGHLNFDRLLGLSATPTRNLLRGTFTPNDIHTYSIADEKRYKKLYPELYTLPDISFYLYNPSNAIKAEMQYYKEEDNFNWNKFFQIENGRLKYKNDIEIFFKWISGSYGSGIKAPLKKLDANSILMFVQNNECQPYLVEVLNSIEYYKENYDIHYTNSSLSGGSTELLWKTKNEFIPRNGRKVIVIANRQLTTGITLKKCDMVMFMNEWASMDEYIQACYRCQSPFYDKILKKWKTTCSVVDFTPYRTFKIFKEFIEVNYISGNKPLEERYVEFFNSISLFECNENGEFKSIDLDGFKNRLIDVMDIASKNYFSESLIKKSLINGDIERLLVFGEMESGLDRGTEDARLDDNGIEKGKTKIIEKTSKDKKDIKEEDDKYRVALENAKYILNKTLFLALFTGCKIDDIGSILTELEKDTEKQKFYIDSLIGVENIAFEDVVYIYKNFFDESLVNDRIRTFNTKIRNLIYTKNKYERVINIEKVIDLINSYIGVSVVEKKIFAEVMTDFSIIDEILDLFDKEDWKDPHKKWFGPTAGIGNFQIRIVQRLMIGLKDFEPDDELRYKHILENMIYVCELQTKNMFIYLMLFDPNNEYKMNYYRGSFLGNGFDEHMKNIWKVDKFDKCAENPPFNQMIDMDILQKTYSLCDQTIFVHPSTWLLDKKNQQKKFIKTKDFVGKDLEQIILFNGNIIFNIGLFVPCAITNFIKNRISSGVRCLDKINNIEIIYNSINDINKYSNTDIFPKLKNKILETCKIDCLINYKNINRGNYFINIAEIRGHVNQKEGLNMVMDDFYTITTKDLKISNEVSKKLYFSFETEKESINFLNYTKTNFARFSLSLYKNTAALNRGEFKCIPWLDFTKEWTDDKLYDYFNLSEDEIEFIEKNIPKYY